MSHSENLSFFAWNINGKVSKLEHCDVYSAFSPYDIVILTELKTEYKIDVPGYVTVRSAMIEGESARGGVLVLFRNYLWPSVNVRQVLKDQVWFQVHPLDFVFGACYIAPSDSAFFDPASFSHIQEHCLGNNCDVLIMGDLNARLGDLSPHADLSSHRYSTNTDTQVNSNGRELSNLCRSCGIVPVNHLVCQQVACDGDLTFRRGGDWVSQLDWALISRASVGAVREFKILREADLPSDHAPIALQLSTAAHAHETLLQRAQQLCRDQYKPDANTKAAGRRPIQFQRVNISRFSNNLTDPGPLMSLCEESPDEACAAISEALYQACRSAKEPPGPRVEHHGTRDAHERWLRLIQQKDYQGIWGAVNWRGGLSSNSLPAATPSETELIQHYSSLLNPENLQESSGLICPDEGTYCPVLDDPITENEVRRSIGRSAVDKAPGLDGVPPGILRFVPVSWVPLLMCLFNIIFDGNYPAQWHLAKICSIFKKGNPLLPANYRGISILDALYKVYDSILAERFNLWYIPDVEQAGAQAGRGCQEQLLTLRLLIDVARKSKQRLYVVFVDYKTAYDKVNRQLLVDKLAAAGCGLRFLRAIANTLNRTTGIVGEESFLASAGVRQGGLTSCSLFTFYINSTIRKLNELGPDGFLGNLHSLLLMDDTVILATSRDGILQKLKVLMETCNSLNMQLHPAKTKFFAVNTRDTELLVVHQMVIQHTRSYVYLGSPILNSTIQKQVSEQIALKQCQARKFRSFLRKNSEAPFAVKKAVWESAMISSVLYSCETWLTSSLKPAEQLYQHTLKDLVGVRYQTPSDLVHVETGILPLSALVTQRQRTFLLKLQASSHFEGSPVQKAIELAREHACPMFTYMQNLLDPPRASSPAAALADVKDRIRSAGTSRAATYLMINPALEVQDVYRGEQSTRTFEPHRVAFSRVRLGAHRLRVETGRWSHTPRDARVCTCGPYVQDEDHVIRKCTLTRHVSHFDESTPLSSALSLSENPRAPELCHAVLAVFQ